MKIANVSSVSLKNNKKTRQNQTLRSQDLTSFGNSNATDSVASKQAADAIKSNFLNNVSFKGQTENIIHGTYGTSGAVNIGSYPDSYYDSYGYRGHYNNEQDAIERKIPQHRLYHENSSVEKTSNSYKTNRIYFADPEEVVNAQTKRDHDYIVYDNYVDFPSLAEVRENYFNKEVDAKNFGQTFKNIAEFHYRRELADKRELTKLQKEKEPIQKEYDLSLEYKNDLDDKMNKFPWQVDSLKKDKEKADYFYAINKEKLDNINQKIGYYTDRITYSKHRQELAVQAFRIFDEVGLMFMERDNIRHEIGYKNDTIRYAENSIKEESENIIKLNNQKSNTEEEMSALSTLIKVNNKKISEINEKLESNNCYNEYSLRSNKKEIEQENSRLTYKITRLNEKLEEINKEMVRSQNYKKGAEGRLAEAKEYIPKLQARFEQKVKEIQDYYIKMHDFYKQNIEG